MLKKDRFVPAALWIVPLLTAFVAFGGVAIAQSDGYEPPHNRPGPASDRIVFRAFHVDLAPQELGRDAMDMYVFNLKTEAAEALRGEEGIQLFEAPASMISRLGLPESGFNERGYEYWNNISSLKAGLVYADKLSTVSPTYSSELMTEEYGMGLDGVLRERQEDLIGILNGIDEELWRPPYKSPAGKAKHRAALREEFGLPDWPGPICVLVSRLTEQKGIDILLQALPALLDRGGQLVILGSGDRAFERAFQGYAEAHPGVSATIGYDEALARRMIAGGDAILVPSRFEPCGLTQLYGLRHGTLPVVGLTGGLADTVINASPAGLAAGAATGLQFHPLTAQALAQELVKLVNLYQDRVTWTKMMKNAMAAPVGWDQSAATYAALYAEMVRPG